MKPFDVADVVNRYVAGETIKRIAESVGVSRPTITRRIRAAGIEVRSMSETQYRLSAARTPEERMRLAGFAHAAVRGVPQREENRCKVAATRERMACGASYAELRLATWLANRGLHLTPQKAIGRYNVDIAIHEGSVAVEIFGGNWHASGTHAARYRNRCDYILDRGWALVVVWVNARMFPLTPNVADYLVSLSKRRGLDESKWSQEQVIRGTGDILVSEMDPNTGSAVPRAKPSDGERGNDGRFTKQTTWVEWGRID